MNNPPKADGGALPPTPKGGWHKQPVTYQYWGGKRYACHPSPQKYNPHNRVNTLSWNPRDWYYEWMWKLYVQLADGQPANKAPVPTFNQNTQSWPPVNSNAGHSSGTGATAPAKTGQPGGTPVTAGAPGGQQWNGNERAFPASGFPQHQAPSMASSTAATPTSAGLAPIPESGSPTQVVEPPQKKSRGPKHMRAAERILMDYDKTSVTQFAPQELRNTVTNDYNDSRTAIDMTNPETSAGQELRRALMQGKFQYDVDRAVNERIDREMAMRGIPPASSSSANMYVPQQASQPDAMAPPAMAASTINLIGNLVLPNNAEVCRATMEAFAQHMQQSALTLMNACPQSALQA